MKYLGLFDMVTQMFIMVIPEVDIERYKQYLDSPQYMLFKLEKYEFKKQQVREEV